MSDPKTERLIFSASPTFIQRIDEFRANHPKLPSRAQAIRVLINVGLYVAKNRDKLESLQKSSGDAKAILEEVIQRHQKPD